MNTTRATITTAAKSVTIPFFRVGVEPLTTDQIIAVLKAVGVAVPGSVR